MTEMLPYPSLVLRQQNSVPALTDERLFEACGVRIAFTGRAGGVSSGPYESLNTGDHVNDDPACVRRNRQIVLESLGLASASVVVPNQVHGTDIVRVSDAADVARAQAQASEGADAVVVEAPEVAALLNFADCLPLIIVSPSGRFAVAHAGWRGALAGIAGKAARELALADAAEGADAAGGFEGGEEVEAIAGFNAYIGPHIRSECFETSADIARQFAERFGEEVLADDRHVSLARVVSTDLARAGISPDRIADAQVCTVCNSDRYFSYRVAGGTCGRHAAIAIRDGAVTKTDCPAAGSTP